jgi:hypothetical protein
MAVNRCDGLKREKAAAGFGPRFDAGALTGAARCAPARNPRNWQRRRSASASIPPPLSARRPDVAAAFHAAGTRMRRKAGRPHKSPGAPVEHKLTPRMREAITALVETGKDMEAAAAAAGLTASAIYKALKHAPAREFYLAELKLLLTAAKAKAAHALIRELDGSNAASRVAAARTLLESDKAPQISAGMPQVPGFSILLVDARAQQPKAIDVTPKPVLDESPEED